MFTDIPAPGFTLTKGRKPKTGERPLRIQLKSGFVDMRNTYTADQLRWSDTGSGSDIAAVRMEGVGG